ncbi:MAG: hypothetical protein NTW14_07085 [bacterium]|nr:hypothetical protein [bacterium]
MNRKDIILVAFSPAKGAWHSPVQVQKMIFLMTRNIPNLTDDAGFNFIPYNYGPFDPAVYRTLEDLAQENLVDMDCNGKWYNYRLTVEGQEKAENLFATLDEDVSTFLTALSQFVRNLSFTELVSAIYRAYPEMRENSVFQE